jgi:hypothetical protein
MSVTSLKKPIEVELPLDEINAALDRIRRAKEPTATQRTLFDN